MSKLDGKYWSCPECKWIEKPAIHFWTHCPDCKEDGDFVDVILLPMESPPPPREAVAWRAWGTPWKGREKCWVYWDEYPDSIKDDPEFTQFGPLYAAAPVTTGWTPTEDERKTLNSPGVQ